MFQPCVKNQVPNSNSATPLIVGTSVAGVVVVIAAIILVIVLTTKKKGYAHSDSDTDNFERGLDYRQV